MPHITSRDNPLLKRLRKLLTSGSERREQGLIVLDGPHLLQAYLQSHGATGVQVVVAQSSRRDDAEIVRLADQVETVIEVGDALIGTLSPSNTPVGVVALAPMPVPSQRVAGDCVLIECVQDPGNVGAILRTASAAGFSRVYLSTGCADVWSPKCLRGGMGAHFDLVMEERVDLARFVSEFTGDSVALDVRAPDSVFDIAMGSPLAVVLGGEGAGLSQALLQAATRRCRIPMQGHAESLNVAVAAAIVMFEQVRRRTQRA